MAEAKLTAAQKNEIFHRAIFDGLSDAQLAEEYGVCRKTIYRITHDKKRIERKRSTLETMRELAKLRVMASAERAAQKQIELMDRQVPENMLYINQNAAADILNRAGIRQEAKDAGELRVVFGGDPLTVNMPRNVEGPEPAAAGGGNRQAERRESQGAAVGRDYASSPGS